MINEAFEAVENLNQEVYDYFERYGLFFPLFEFETDGFSIIINFMRYQRLWFSDEDERDYNKETNKYEPLEQYLRRESQGIINQIGSLKLISQKPCPQCVGRKEELGSRFCRICGRDLRAFGGEN